MSTYNVGLDIGSTTVKIVVIDNKNNLIFSRYKRHQANIVNVLLEFFTALRSQVGSSNLRLTITGSVGMGFAEKFNLPFVQEVIASTKCVRTMYPDISTIIDIGGEDAKIVYLKPDGSADLRMNGNCAGGTGAFIDQMAILLNEPVENMNTLAEAATHTYAIASRCGVFSKTDIQNLLSKNVSKPDIAASIFHAVAIQTISTLSHGCTITPKVLFCGGPLTFMPALRKALMDYLELPYADFLVPEKANLLPAWGTALSADNAPSLTVDKILALLNDPVKPNVRSEEILPAIFTSQEDYAAWRKAKEADYIHKVSLSKDTGTVFLGIDSGSTTTKLVVIDSEENILFTYYLPNNGNPIAAVRKALDAFHAECIKHNANPIIMGSCSTGYGEDLIKAAFNLNTGIIETIAHYLAAKKINPKVSFILDIGGQDMKAIFVDNGILSRTEINEACSSGCGTFIETFAKSLNYAVEDFARIACLAKEPCDLGTRCTVFMNSKVKQVLREGVTTSDIAAGLSYSVIKNCLYKVLKLKDGSELGTEIVLQGGTMKNDAVVRAFELLTNTTVHRSNVPEIMGAYGCALHAKGNAQMSTSLDALLKVADYTTTTLNCKGCENCCYIQKYAFSNGNIYYSGNKCEKIFTNEGKDVVPGTNIYDYKYDLLFNRPAKEDAKRVIGIPRCLNMYENYPFWHALFTFCGLKVLLSEPSNLSAYEHSVHSVMSDNICFPAKLAHSHINYLIEKKVDRIFMPYVVYEKQEDSRQINSFNCPIITGYPDVIRSVTPTEIPIDAPVITFKDEKKLKKQLTKYLGYIGVDLLTIKGAIASAYRAQTDYETAMKAKAKEILADSVANHKITIVLAGRPYHTDPLVQHKLSSVISAMGINVISEDLVRNDELVEIHDAYLTRQWAYINRIIKAADWVARQDASVHFMQMTSFGCGPDAFLLDEVRGILHRHGKALTILKIDDVNNIGSLKLRVRSVIESIKYNNTSTKVDEPFISTKVFGNDCQGYTLLVPYFTDFISPLIPSIFKLIGYNLVTLPKSDLVSADMGLKYANNEVCYPATLVVGDFLRALSSGKYDLKRTAVVLTQTGGQCRATNYLGLVKQALVSAGYKDVPVISVNNDKRLGNLQPGFKINWLKIGRLAVVSILFSDCLSKFYHAAIVRETAKGKAEELKEKYLSLAVKEIEKNSLSGLFKLLKDAAIDFNAISKPDIQLPQVGIVGEIYLKFNAFAHKNVTTWLMEHNIEVMPPMLSNFFLQFFVNRLTNKKLFLDTDNMPTILVDFVYTWITKQINKINKIGQSFDYFTPFDDIFDEAKNGRDVISMAAQFGEGWLLPAEIVSFAKEGIYNVISLQPFGCIANHIISKGIEKKIKDLYPEMNLLSLDFDSGVSDVNVMNRLLLFVTNIKVTDLATKAKNLELKTQGKKGPDEIML